MFRRLMFVLALVGAALLGPGALLASAQEIPNDAPAVAPVATLTINAFLVLVLTSLLIPVLTGVASRWVHSTTGLQIVTAAISAVSGILTTSSQIDGTAVISGTTVQYALLAFGIATFGYIGLLKPHGVNAKLGGS